MNAERLSGLRSEPRLCVVGTGALGSALLDRLRHQQFAAVLLVDPDAVEERNLLLSPFLRRSVVHSGALPHPPSSQNKAHLLAEAAQRLDSLPWRSAACEIADVGWADLLDIDLLCCCTDTILSRVETAWIAQALGKPMLDGGVVGQGIAAGRVTAYPGTISAACALCGLAEDRRAAVLGYAASASLGCQAPQETPAMMAALDTLDAVADAMLASILRRQQIGREVSCTTKLTQAAEGNWRMESFQLTRSATCPWHSGFPGTLEMLAWDQPVAPALEGGRRQLVLNWPICTQAACRACGFQSRPMQRVAQVRRAPCPACALPQQQPLRAIHRIRQGDPSSALSPRQLGLPERHLYWLHDTVPAQTGGF